jgi:hypothetical protein
VIKLENENNLFEWSDACAFFITMCRHYQYLESKDPERLEARDKSVTYIQNNFTFKNEDVDIMEFFEKNYEEILEQLEPNIIIDFRVHRKGISKAKKR